MGEQGSKNPKKGHFMDAESIQETLKIFNLTTTYAILMKLTTGQFHQYKEVCHLAKSWVAIHRV